MKTKKTTRIMKRNFICILTGLILSGLLGMASISLAREGTWAKKADMPTPRNSFATAVVDGCIYTFGGRIDAFDGMQTVEAYNPTTDQWVKKADMPTGRRAPAATVVDGKIFVIGGHEGDYSSTGELGAVEVYDPATDTWAEKADMPNPRSFLTAEVVDGKIYVIAGWAKGDKVSVVEVYDPATDKWTENTPIPIATSHHGSGVVSKKIYVIGGEWDTESAVFEYEPIADTWSRKSDMPTGRDSFGASTLNGRLYAIGGVKAPFVGTIATVERYDPATDTWEKLEDMPTARAGLSTAVVNRRVYAIGGATGLPYGNPGDMLGTVEEYTPEGWKATSVSPRGKLTTTWGEMKHGR